MSFVRRVLDVTFALGTGEFGGSGATNVKLSGLRVSAKVVKGVGPSMSRASVSIYGMTLSMMNQLSTLGMVVLPTDQIRRNNVTIEAGDEGGAMSTVFDGTISRAWEDFQAAPEVAFQVEAFTGLYEAVKPAEPTSYGDGTPVVTIMEKLAGDMELKFENNGVDGVLSYPYHYGSARDQAQRAADAAGINMIIDDKKLAIWPRGQAREGSSVPLVSPQTGMIGYPTYTSKGILVRKIYDPAIVYGTKIQIESQLTGANGEWIIQTLDYDLDANLPGGQWSQTMNAARPGMVVLR